MYIYDNESWPELYYSTNAIINPLARVRHLQGKLLGEMKTLGFHLREDATLSTLTLDILKSSEIEGEKLDKEQVRSSIARRLGMEIPGLVNSSHNVEGIVEMMLDATQNYTSPLSEERIFGWHAALFPTGWSGMYRIEVGKYRTGAMQVVSGAMGKEKIHFEAPEAQRVPQEMRDFIDWINNDDTTDPVIKAAIAHFRFITIHPFDDGNGRIARGLTDMLLARSDNTSQRFYSMSNQILAQKNEYYDILERLQRGSGDLTEWLLWFLACLEQSILSTEKVLESTMAKARFWDAHSKTVLNDRQRKMLNKVMDGFDGKLTTSKWAKICKCSVDTAQLDVKDLISKGVLRKTDEGGKNTNYKIIM